MFEEDFQRWRIRAETADLKLQGCNKHKIPSVPGDVVCQVKNGVAVICSEATQRNNTVSDGENPEKSNLLSNGYL